MSVPLVGRIGNRQVVLAIRGGRGNAVALAVGKGFRLDLHVRQSRVAHHDHLERFPFVAGRLDLHGCPVRTGRLDIGPYLPVAVGAPHRQASFCLAVRADCFPSALTATLVHRSDTKPETAICLPGLPGGGPIASEAPMNAVSLHFRGGLAPRQFLQGGAAGGLDLIGERIAVRILRGLQREIGFRVETPHRGDAGNHWRGGRRVARYPISQDQPGRIFLARAGTEDGPECPLSSVRKFQVHDFSVIAPGHFRDVDDEALVLALIADPGFHRLGLQGEINPGRSAGLLFGGPLVSEYSEGAFRLFGDVGDGAVERS